MDELKLEQKEEKITKKYRDFLAEVREAFNKHCDRIRAEATRKLKEIPEENQDARENIMNEQKAQLDKTLTELTQLLARKEAEVRSRLEKIANLKERGKFSFEDELAQVEEDHKEHAA